MTEHVIKLEEVGRDDVATAGGKGANLGELIQSGFPVPPGFVIPAQACRSFFEHIGLTREIKGLATAAGEGLERRCETLRRRIEEADLPFELEKSILEAHAELKKARGAEIVCAVRSSATAEDLGQASFAGQHETYYYVKQDRLLKMVKHCWSSLWSPEAVSYRQTQGIDHASVFMAVVVQEMVLAEVSGVTFTTNPVTVNPDEVVTESSWGMGAAIVDGRVTPDHYVLSRDSLAVKEKRISHKKLMVPPILEGGGDIRLVEVPYEMRHQETLSTEQAREAAHWALKAEEHFGGPQDVEWAINDGQFYLLQSRPITVMGKVEVNENVKGKWVLFKPLVENFTDPLTPLMCDMFGRLLAVMPGVRIIKGWLYMDVSAVKFILPFKATDEQVVQLLYGLGQETPPMKLSWLKLPVFSVLILLFYLLNGVIYARAQGLPDDFMDQYRDLARRVDEDEDIGPYDTLLRLWSWGRIFDPIGFSVILVNLVCGQYMIGLAFLRGLIRRWAPNVHDDAEALLCSGSEGILSAEMGRSIWALAQQAREQPALKELLENNRPEGLLARIWEEPAAEAFSDQLDEFLKKNGHRGLKELELRSQRWEENPAPVLGMIRNYLLVESDPTTHEQKTAELRRRVEADIRKKLEDLPWERFLGLRWRLIKSLMQRIRYFIKNRENSRFYHILGMHITRKKVLKAEARLMREGKLKCKDDIFFLTLDEIETLLAGRLGWRDVEELIQGRRMEHIRLSKTTPPKTIGIQVCREPRDEECAPAGVDVLQGQPASPGRYNGQAQVILDPSLDVELKPGQVLVAPYTDPAWTPLFLTAGAAVVEVGSYLSHAGTVAREFGMPCVVDVENCTSRIQTGMRIRVDGDRGLVHLVKDEEGDGS